MGARHRCAHRTPYETDPGGESGPQFPCEMTGGGRACNDSERSLPMQYMMLIYTKETESGPTREESEQVKAAHRAETRRSTRKSVLPGADPPTPTPTATTVPAHDGKSLITETLFAETEHRLAACTFLNEH